MTEFGIAQLFAAPVKACIANESMYDFVPTRGELEIVKFAVRERVRQFSAGRAAARIALAQFGAFDAPLVVDNFGLIIWPSGLVGSITHCAGFCAAVVGRKCQIDSLGLDAEVVGILGPEEEKVIRDENDRITLETPGRLRRDVETTVIFSAKEAFYKCYFPIAKKVLDFKDVFVQVSGSGDASFGTFVASLKDRSLPHADLGPYILGKWLVAGGYVFSGASLLRDSIE